MTTDGIAGTGSPPGRPAMAAKGKKADKNDTAAIQEMLKRFGLAQQYESDNRASYVEDVNFSSSADHWTDDVKKMRGTGRPTLTFNRLNGVVKNVIGDYRQNKLAIKILPSGGGADEDKADIIAGMIRNIEVESVAEFAYVNGLECSARGGFGWFRVLPEYEGDDVFTQSLRIRPIHNSLTVYCDTSARLPTREDANWIIVTERMPLDEFSEQYPNADPVGVANAGSDGDGWIDKDEIRVAEYFTKEKTKVKLVAFANGAVVEIENDEELRALEAIGWQPTKERESERVQIRWRKCTANEVLEQEVYKIKYIPVVRVSGEEVNLEGKVYSRSVVYYAKDAQRMYNYWKTSATESVALSSKAPWLVTNRHIEGYEEQWDNVNTMPQPYLVYEPDPNAGGPPQRIEPPNQPIGEMAMAGQAGQDIQYTTGIFDASLGQKSNEQSGIAIGERQQQSTTSTYIFIDNLKKAIEQCGRICVDWIPSIYDTERVVRIIGLEGDTDEETINQSKINPILGVTEVLNDIRVGKYDVIVEAGKAFASRRAEAVDGMMKFMAAQPQLGSLIADLAVKNMDWPGSDEIAARLKRALPPGLTIDPDSPEGQQIAQQQQQQQQAQQQAMQQHAQIEQGKQQAEMAKSQASVIKSQAEVVKAKADTVQALHESGSERVDQARTEPKHQAQTPVINISTQNTPEHEQNNAMLHQSISALGEHLAASHHMNAAQTVKTHELLAHLANGHHHIIQALDHNTQVASAPEEVVRDKTGKVIGKRKVMQ